MLEQDEDGHRDPPPTSQTGQAAKAFVSALAADIARGARLGGKVLGAAAHKARASAAARRIDRGSPFQRIMAAWAKGVLALVVLCFVAFGGAMVWALHEMPVDGLSDSHRSRPSILLQAADGSPIGRIGPLKAAPAARKDFPDILVKAVTSVEDRRFFGHPGIDVQGILRAAFANLSAGGVVQGGSTITQQYVKYQMLGDERTAARKVKEAATAIWLERRLGKDEILTRYLNSVYLGGGAYGMAAAARLYFDKELSQLTLAEAAMLAGLIKAPSQYSPFRSLEDAQTRAIIVLDAMVDAEAITREEADSAKASPAILYRPKLESEARSWFADWIAQEAAEVGAGVSQALRVRTTLDPNMQQIAEDVVRKALAGRGAAKDASQAALVAMRPDGAVVAMVGGRDYGESQFNRAVQANRQPGSAFKLFVYLAALQKGYTPDSVIDASPLELKGWKPENFGGERYGRLVLTDAFARSVNTAAVQLAMKIGIDSVIATARDLGIEGPLTPTPSLALGSSEVNLLSLTAAYAAIRAGRAPIKPWGISAFGPDDQTWNRSIGAPAIAQHALGPPREAMMTLLRAVVERGTARGAALPGYVAGKTGTSQDHRDAWFIGFNDTLVVGVWLGNDDRSPMDAVTGGSLPAAIWKEFVSRVTPSGSNPSTLPPLSDSGQMAGVGLGPAQCDFQACAATYSSFRASDCSFQPYNGPRQVCVKTFGGAAPPPPRTDGVTTASLDASAKPEADGSEPAAGACNIAECAATYSSFRASDCTYQPLDGSPRRICGRPAGRAAAPARTERVIEKPAEEEAPRRTPFFFRRAESQGDTQGNSCNAAACAGMPGFNPADCTYQPPGGGRRLLCSR